MTITDGDVSVRTPKRGRQLTFLTRNDTNDAALVVGIVIDDEYGLGQLPDLTGTVIDIGAHVGSVALSLARDHDVRVIAVEPVAENCAVLRRNIEYNDLGDRVTVIEAAAAAPGSKVVDVLWDYRTAGAEPEAYVKDSRYIANIYDAAGSDADSHRVPAVSLDTLMKGIDRIALLKIDCEGCEWGFLRSKRVADVDLIVGEYHNRGGMASLTDLLAATHDVTQTGGHDDVGTFRAVRR